VGIGNSSMSSFNSGYNNLVVGTGSGNEGLTIYAGSANSAYIGLKSAANTSFQGGWEYDFATNDLYTYINGTMRMRINSSGQFMVGVTTPNNAAYTINSSGTGGSWIRGTGTGDAVYVSESKGAQWLYYGLNQSGTNTFYVLENGNVRNTNNSYGAISDIKLKENITDATPKLNDLLNVKIRNYNLIGDTTKQIGVIAQELEQVFPSLIESNSTMATETNTIPETIKSVKYSVFVPILIKAIQEQQALIENLTIRLAALENK
jgi:hypothetical protein